MKLFHIFFTSFSIIMSSSSSIMVHIAPCFQELWSFIYENSHFKTMSVVSKLNSFDRNFMKLGHII